LARFPAIQIGYRGGIRIDFAKPWDYAVFALKNANERLPVDIIIGYSLPDPGCRKA